MGKKQKRASRRASDHVAPAKTKPSWQLPVPVGLAGAVFVGVGLAFLVLKRSSPASNTSAPASSARPTAQYVGTSACETCHRSETSEWRLSQHERAMAAATDQSVLGDFGDAKFTYAGTTSTFFKREGKFFVRTDGPDGALADFEIRYTFGVDPLQQYLIEFPDGRLQALSIAWDARPKEKGGQRWFHLYPHERVRHDDELHWTGPAQNWNFMCADCHSTDVRKNYDAATNRFQTRWSEISVGCEACHGPGSRHVTWAEDAARGGRSRSDSTKGLVARLEERHGVTWAIDKATGNATRSTPRSTEHELDVCAQCHSRRSQIADGYRAGDAFLDFYRPALLTRPLYHADGQQRDEVYTWGPFLQSRMNAHGVTCSDCHNPHSGKPRATGNAVCAGCHLSSKYDTSAHHHHRSASTGAACTSCHMPSATYMVVDPRHDHSLRVPRPDLSVKFGTPNACTSCHVDRGAAWAVQQVRRWYGHDAQGYQRFAEAFGAADSGGLGADVRLRVLAGDQTQSPIARATAVAQLNAPAIPDGRAVVAASLADARAIVRLGALESVTRLPPAQRLKLVAPLLADPLRALRVQAASALAGVPAPLWSMDQRTAFQRAFDELIETQRWNSDRAEGRANLGTFLAERGDIARGEAELEAAIRLNPYFAPAYVNLADVYRGNGRDADGERVLRDGLARAPQSAVLHYALGLVLTRLNRSDSALHEFARAASLEPTNARFAYVHAIALHSAGKIDAAIAKLQAAVTAHPGDGDILSALTNFVRARGDSALANRYANRLRLLTGNR